MEDAQIIFDYLPVSFKSRGEQDYIAFLWDAFQSNYSAGKYQFAYLAFHMLTMSFVYFTIWQIKQALPDDFAKAMVGFNKDAEKNLMDATSPFTFSDINESSIFRFLKLVGCDNGKIGKYAQMVRDRNEIAHPNGNIFYNAQKTVDDKIAATLKLIDEIQQHSKPAILHCYEHFLIGNYDSENREFPDTADQLREILVHGNYFAQADINFCLAYEIEKHSSHHDFAAIQDLHNTFVATYRRDDE